jgi:hypothetical protein
MAKILYYKYLREAGHGRIWFDNKFTGGQRSDYIFQRPERLPLPFIMQLALIANLDIGRCITVLWQANVKGSEYYSNKLFDKGMVVVLPPSNITAARFSLKPFDRYYCKHFRGSKLAVAIYEARYRAQDLDAFFRFPVGGFSNMLRHPLICTTIPDVIRLAVILNTDFNNAFKQLTGLQINADIPLILPKFNRASTKDNFNSFTTFDMIRHLKGFKG